MGMRAESLSLLQALEARVGSVFADVETRSYQDGECLVRQGHKPEGLLLMSSGLAQARWSGLEEGDGPVLGPGSVVGDVSYLLGGVASASVVVLERVEALLLPRQALDRVREDDPSLGLRIFEALAAINAQRLIDQTHGLQPLAASQREPQPSLPSALAEALTRFKQSAAAFEADLRRSDPDPVLHRDLALAFSTLVRLTHQGFPPLSGATPAPEGPALRALRQELLPYLLLTRSAERMYRKPRGYAGDFLTIDWMYADEPGGTGALGVALDRCFLDQPAAQAVRNRRVLLLEELQRALSLTEHRPLRVTSLACGPAAEIFDILLQEPELAEQVEFTLVDVDQQALEHVEQRLAHHGLAGSVRLERRNLLHLCVGRQDLDLQPQHLIYSIGLIDYFDDRIVTRLQRWIHSCLAPGGRSILGNFHTSNPTRGLMDHLLDWRLIHRDEADMLRLAAAAGFADRQTSCRFEAAGVNLFAISVR